VCWALTLGVRGTYALLARLFATVLVLLKPPRAYLGDAAAEMRRAHDARVAERAAASGLDAGRLRELLALQSRPIGATFRGVLASVMLDRLAIGLFVVLTLTVIALLVRLGPLAGYGLHAAGVVVAIWIALHFYLSAGRGSVDPAKQMTERAARIARMFRAPYVVMGHTHVPLSEKAGEATYINVGSWAEEDDETSSYRAARTHLVIHEREGRAEALLYEWRAGDGPRLRAV
jgi:hypothetical protein